MKQIVRLTESELKNIVEKAVIRAVNEGAVEEGKVKDFLKSAGKTAGKAAVGGAFLGLTLGTKNPVSDRIEQQFDRQEKLSQADPETKKEYGDKLKPKSERDKKAKKDKKTASWPSNKNVPSMINTEARIHRAIMESLNRLMNDRI